MLILTEYHDCMLLWILHSHQIDQTVLAINMQNLTWLLELRLHEILGCYIMLAWGMFCSASTLLRLCTPANTQIASF